MASLVDDLEAGVDIGRVIGGELKELQFTGRRKTGLSCCCLRPGLKYNFA